MHRDRFRSLYERLSKGEEVKHTRVAILNHFKAVPEYIKGLQYDINRDVLMDQEII